MATNKRKSLADSVKPIDAEGAAAVADKLTGGAKATVLKSSLPLPSSGALGDTASQSYNLPIDQISLLADVAAARASDARKRREKVGRISASGILRELIEAATPDLEAELKRLRK